MAMPENTNLYTEMNMSELNEYLNERHQLVEAKLAKSLQPVYPGAERLFAAMEYSLLAGGKRLRPLLLLAAAEGFGASVDDVLPFALGIEMLHTYSLIHDDLPAMDDDDMRRGRPSCHRQFDEATAILAGDGLLTHAFAMQVKTEVKAEYLTAAMGYFAANAGIYGMVAGQVLDLAAEGKSVTMSELKAIHRAKTGALLAAAVVCGGILAGADEAEQAALANFGYAFGLAFQIVDDILDEVGDTKLLGKPVGSDAANHKVTYVSLLGLDGAKQAACDVTAEAKLAVAPLGEKGRRLAQMAEYYLQREF